MFQRLIMAIFRLYMKCLLSSYTKYKWAVYMGRQGVHWARGLVSVSYLGLILSRLTALVQPSSINMFF